MEKRSKTTKQQVALRKYFWLVNLKQA